MRKILPGLLLSLCVAADGLCAAVPGDAPVEFTLPRLDGGTVSLSDYRGRWVVLNYWATWCAPCRREIPELSTLDQDREDIAVLGLAFEDTDPENFDAFLKSLKPAYPLLQVDVYAPPEPFGAPKVLPTTFIVDPAGRPRKTFMGPVTAKDIETFVDSQTPTKR